MLTYFPLLNQAAFAPVQILHRIFKREDMPVSMVVEKIDHRRQSGGFAAAGRPVTRINPLSLDNSSGMARGTPSEESGEQVRGSNRRAMDTPLICLNALPRRRWPSATVTAKST